MKTKRNTTAAKSDPGEYWDGLLRPLVKKSPNLAKEFLAKVREAKLTFGGSLFVSSGSRPTRYYEPLARLSVPMGNHVSWNTEW